jgi:hypothetical protein
MKRFVIATASALFLLAGTAAAVPVGSASRVAHDNTFSSSAIGGPRTETVAPDGFAPLVPGLDPAAPDPGLALPLPEGVSELLGTVNPALANLVEALPAPVADSLSPVIGAPAAVEPPAPVPGLTGPQKEPEPKQQPAPAAAQKQAKGLIRKANLRVAAAATDIFGGLPANGAAAYGTGSVIHVHALQTGQQRLENTDAAFSGATFASAPISGIKNEVARVVAPALAAGNAFGRGSGLEVGLATGQSDPNQIIPGSVAEAKAPPSTELITTEVGPVDAAPVVHASLLRGQAQSKANAACTTGTDLSYGLGYASDLGLLSAAALGSPLVQSAAEGPDRAASQSRSHTFLVGQDGAPNPIRKFGLASETRMTIAPITLFKDTANEVTLEFAGEWVLRTIADGKTAKVFYGPGNVSPSTPLVRVLKGATVVDEILSTQSLFGPNGLVLDVSPLVKITIGTPPRMINGDETSKPIETPTLAAAAVDVVKIQLLSAEGLTAADLRIGHMENATAVPAGGLECGIQMNKVTDKDVVGPGDSFVWTITVTNPNDCVLTQLRVVDTITADPRVVWTVESATPSADSKSNNSVTWNDIGPLKPNESKELTIGLTVGRDSLGGRFHDLAKATGVCGPAQGTAGAEAAVGVPLESSVSLDLPEVNAALGALLPRELPRTGGVLTLIPALALTGGGLVLRASRRRKQK